MGILDEDIRRVRDATDIVAVVTEHTQLKRSGTGDNWVGLCPFPDHNEKSPSFSVNASKNVYYCFGCGQQGDVITFVREIEGLDFAGAVERLAGRAGITLRYTSSNEGEHRGKRKQLIEAMEKAVDWYHERLLSSPDAAEARKYLRGRGLDGEIVRQYRIGWAPDDWDLLVKDVGVPFDRLQEVNLTLLNKRNRRQDVFRNRILFPIFDAQGDPVAFGGRVLPGGDGPKYRNSSETPIYAKSKVLYGLNWAKGDIVKTNEAIVCEGYTDVIGMARVGLGRAVAPCGTSLTEDHVRLLTRFGNRIVLAFDADAAGDNAAARFYAWEAKYDVEVYVAGLPSGSDPGDLAASDPDGLRWAVKPEVRKNDGSLVEEGGAKPFLRFRLEKIVRTHDIRSDEGRARAAREGLAAIAEHPDPVRRDRYLMDLGFLAHVEPEALRRLGVGRSADAVHVYDPLAAGRELSRSTEIEALRLLIERRAEIAHLLDVALFSGDLTRATYEQLSTSGSFDEAVGAAANEVSDLLQRIVHVHASRETKPVDVAALLVRDALKRDAASARRVDDFALAHELNGLADRIQVPDVDVTVVDKALELLRAHERGSHDGGDHD